MNTKFDDWYERLLIDAELIDGNYTIKNIPILRPFGIYIYNTIMRYIEGEWYKQGIEKIHLPLIMPKALIKSKSENANEVGNEMFNLFNIWIKSYNDLPYKVQRTCMINNNEPDKIIPFIKEGERYVNEIYTCHNNIMETYEEIELALQTYENILSFFGIYGVRVRKPQNDTIKFAESSDVIVTSLKSGKVLEIVRVHNLGEKYSREFNIRYQTKDNKLEYTRVTCHNTSTRLLAACISAHSDINGLVLPSLLCKYHVVILVLDNESERYGNELFSKLKSEYKIHIDTSGGDIEERRKYYDRIGVGIRLEIERNEIYIKIRNKNVHNRISVGDISKEIEMCLIRYDDE